MSILSLDISKSEWDRLRRLLEIPHRHYEGMNECAICDAPVISCAIGEILDLRKKLAKAQRKIKRIKGKQK